MNIKFTSAFTSFMLCSISLFAQQKDTYFPGSVSFPSEATPTQKAKLASCVVPSQRQLEWQKMEFTCFICYGVNTFSDREWGTGKEDPSIFNPTELDVEQWVRTAKNAGMKMVLLVCKHHDGFCLWPSKTTSFSVASSPWKQGKGDLVKDVSEACKKYGLKFGVYLSPWDMNCSDYGTEKYNDFFIDQLTELLTQYGIVDEVWFDGACGEGPNGKKQIYDFQRYYATIRKLQPNAVIAVMGPDVRWVGTESGYGRDTEWSIIPASASNLEEIAASSQQKPEDATFVLQADKTDNDLGSREKLNNAGGAVWYPSEVDVSIRPGWYYHSAEDDRVKTPQKLIDIYYSSIGKNSLLLLNLPPDKRGLVHENDVKSLEQMRSILNETFETNLAKSRKTKRVLTDGILETDLIPDKDGTIVIDFGKEVEFDRFLVQENITKGQRVEKFKLEAYINNTWQPIAEGTTIGFKRILRFSPVKAKQLRFTITETRNTPHISEIGIYKASINEITKSH